MIIVYCPLRLSTLLFFILSCKVCGIVFYEIFCKITIIKKSFLPWVISYYSVEVRTCDWRATELNKTEPKAKQN